MGALRGLVLHTTLCCLVSADLFDFGTRLVLEKLAGKETIEVTPEDTKAVSDVLRWWFGTGEYAKGAEQPAHALLGAPEGSDGYTDLGHQLLVEWLSEVVNRQDALRYADGLAALGVDRFSDLYELDEQDWPEVMREKKLHLGKVRRAMEEAQKAAAQKVAETKHEAQKASEMQAKKAAEMEAQKAAEEQLQKNVEETKAYFSSWSFIVSVIVTLIVGCSIGAFQEREEKRRKKEAQKRKDDAVKEFWKQRDEGKNPNALKALLASY